MTTGSSLTVRNVQGNFVTADTNRAKIFIFQNEFNSGTLLNASGDEKTFMTGLLLGRISASGNIVPWDATATDGSQFPIGILATTVTLADAATASIRYCINGDVNGGELILDVNGQTLDNVVSGRRLRDRIEADTKGIRLVDVVDQTFLDN